MKRVLIPTSGNPGLLTPLAHAYARRGFEVVGGSENFFLRLAPFDLVHFQWPEEFSGWQPPDDQALARVSEALDWWTAHCPTVVTVHNFYPHLHHGDPRYHQLYRLFYERCSGIVHHSRISIEKINQEWPTTAQRRHTLGVCRSFPELGGPDAVDRFSSRKALGIGDDEFAVLVIGALRAWSECRLIMNAFDRADLKPKRLIMTGRYREGVQPGRWRGRYRRYRWARWLQRRGAVVTHGYLPADEIHRYLNAADAVVIPRAEALSSGIVGLAMTFGKLLIVPNHGAFPEYVAGTENLLYQSGDSNSLATAIERAATLDPALVASVNLRLAEARTLDHTVTAALEAAGLSG
jgi:glycosyltransferase involved in cell wall biosynthesis